MNCIDENGLYVTGKHIFFYGGPFSNFHVSPFEYTAFDEQHMFFCSEQAFMWYKAKTFGDEEIASAILSENSDPLTCKRLGRMVKNYDDNKWNKIRYDVFLAVNIEKFSQNPDLKDLISQSRFEGKMFVEASPTDRIWGIGIAIGNSKIDDEQNWCGQNLLGKCLTEVRERILRK